MDDADCAVAFRLPIKVGVVATILGHESGLRLERVQVQVEGKSLLRLAGKIAVSKSFRGGNCVPRCVEARIYLVGHDARREGLLFPSVGGFSGGGLESGFGLSQRRAE